MTKWLTAIFLLFLAPSLHAETAAPQARLEPAGGSRVVEIVDGDTLALADGREVRLVGIQAPKLPLGRPNFPTWPLASEAKTTLEKLTLGREVLLGYGETRIDRHGRHLAHLFLEDGRWVQGELLKAGMARVYTFPDNRLLAAELQAREDAARQLGQGIWALDFYAVRDHAEVAEDVGSFQLVEGRVHAVARVRERVYLNFEEDWRRDFTILLNARALDMLAEVGVDPEEFEGRRLRVRGWVKWTNGPMIEATHPEQIETLD